MRTLLALLFFALLSLPLQSEAASLLVVVDPGHGGDKEGAIGPGGLMEKEVALAISLKLAAALEEAGHRVVLTRDEDASLSLGARVALANEVQADLFVSVHANSIATHRSRIHGVETYFLSAEASDARAQALAQLENADDEDAAAAQPATPLDRILADLARVEAHVGSSRLAVALHERLVASTGAKDRGVRQAPFFVLTGATMPAVLVEVGYISHPEESRRLADDEQQGKIAAAIADGIVAFGAQTFAAAPRER